MEIILIQYKNYKILKFLNYFSKLGTLRPGIPQNNGNRLRDILVKSQSDQGGSVQLPWEGAVLFGDSPQLLE